MGYLERQRNTGPLPGGCYVVDGKLVNGNGELLAELADCPLCNQLAERDDSAVSRDWIGIAKGYDCLSCGYFIIEKDALAAGFRTRQQMGDHNTLPFLSAVIREITEKRRKQKRKYTLAPPIPVPTLVNHLIGFADPSPGIIGIAELLAPGPLSRKQRIDKTLLNLYAMTDNEGQWIRLWAEDYPLAYVNDIDMFVFLLGEIEKQGLIRCMPMPPLGEPPRLPEKVQLTVEGLARVEQLNAAGEGRTEVNKEPIVSHNRKVRLVANRENTLKAITLRIDGARRFVERMASNPMSFEKTCREVLAWSESNVLLLADMFDTDAIIEEYRAVVPELPHSDKEKVGFALHAPGEIGKFLSNLRQRVLVMEEGQRPATPLQTLEVETKAEEDMRQDDGLLFNKAEVSGICAERERRMISKIDGFTNDDVENADVDALCASVVASFRLMLPAIQEDGITQSVALVQIDVRQHPMLPHLRDRTKPVLKDAHEIIFHIPYTGDASLLQCQPSRFTYNPPRGIVYTNEIDVTYKKTDLDGTWEQVGQQVQGDFDKNLANINEYLGRLASDVTEHNTRLEAVARQRIEEHKTNVRVGREVLAGALRYPAKPKASVAFASKTTASPAPANPNADQLESLLAIDNNRESVRRLVEQLRTPCGIIPFIGAGLSVPFGMPGWTTFLLAQADSVDKQAEVETCLRRGDYEEAAELLEAALTPFQFHANIQAAYGDHNLDGKPLSGAVTHLPQLAAGPVLTTNFDRVLERVFQAAELEFETVVCGAKPDMISRAMRQQRRRLLKLHGDWEERTERVLTKFEYEQHYGSSATGEIDFKLPLPRLLEQILTGSSLLLMGCSLSQDRTVSTLRQVAAKSPEIVHYAVVEQPATKPVLDERRRRLGELNILAIWYPTGQHDVVDLLLADLAKQSK